MGEGVTRRFRVARPSHFPSRVALRKDLRLFLSACLSVCAAGCMSTDFQSSHSSPSLFIDSPVCRRFLSNFEEEPLALSRVPQRVFGVPLDEEEGRVGAGGSSARRGTSTDVKTGLTSVLCSEIVKYLVSLPLPTPPFFFATPVQHIYGLHIQQTWTRHSRRSREPHAGEAGSGGVRCLRQGGLRVV